MQKQLMAADVIALMKKRQGERTLTAFAEELGVSVPYLSDIYLGKRGLSDVMLERFGLKKVKSEQFYTKVA